MTVVNDAEKIVQAIEYAFVSPNEVDSNMENANVVDALCKIARAINHLARAIEDRA